MAKAGDIIAAVIKLRDKRDQIKAQHKKELEPIEGQLEILNNALLQIMDAVGTDSVKERGVGTAYKTLKTSASVADPVLFKEFLDSTGEWDLADIRAAKKNIETYRNEHGALPPGINWSATYDVGVQRGK